MFYVEKKITLVHANNLIILWWERNLKPSVAANVRMFYLKAFNIDSLKRSVQLKLCGVIIPFFFFNSRLSWLCVHFVHCAAQDFASRSRNKFNNLVIQTIV